MKKRSVDNVECVGAKMGRIPQACQRYGLGTNTMRKMAEQAGAIVKIGKIVAVNYTVMDRFFDEITQ